MMIDSPQWFLINEVGYHDEFFVVLSQSMHKLILISSMLKNLDLEYIFQLYPYFIRK